MTRVLMNTDVDGYKKDKDTGVVVNTNQVDYDRFMQQKAQHKEYLKTKQDIASLQTEMVEIKRLLLEKINNG